MTSCNGDFGLLDEAQSHSDHPQQQQQVSATVAACPISFPSHRYIPKVSVPIHSHSLHLNSINSKKVPIGAIGSVDAVGDGQVTECYGDAFTQTVASRHSHCFAHEDPGSDPFDPSQPPVDNDVDRVDNPSSTSYAAASTPNLQQQQLHHALRIESKRRDREELSDGESPYGCNKRSRPACPTFSGDYRKDREEWSDSAIGCLLDAYTEKYIQLNRGNLRGRDWEDVATTVSEQCDKQKSDRTVEQCKNKVDNLKKRYKVECHRLSSGNLAVSHWPWFKKMEQIIGSSSSKAVPDEDKSTTPGEATLSLTQMNRYPANSPISASLTSSFKLKSLSNPRWKRAVLKFSGSALVGTGPQNVDPKVLMLIAREVAMASRVGVEVAIVVGGRNFFCGDTWLAATGIDRATTYQIDMMASAMNALLLQASFEKMGVEARVQTALMMHDASEPYIRRRAIRHLEKGRIVIFGGINAGAVNPLFTTDTAAVLRASDINADAVLKGTNADCVYDCHSRNNCSAFEQISFREFISRSFTNMDVTAVTFCEENNIPVVLFDLMEPNNISRALCGDRVGTLIDHSGGSS